MDKVSAAANAASLKKDKNNKKNLFKMKKSKQNGNISFFYFIFPKAHIIKEVITGELIGTDILIAQMFVSDKYFLLQLSVCQLGRNISPVFRKSNMDSICW